MHPLTSFLVLLLVLAASPLGPVTAHPVTAQDPSSSPRVVIDLDPGWRFSRGDFAGAAMPAFDDKAWQTVDLPHDWSAAGPFTAEYGSGNGYAPGGIAWYRKHLALPSPLEGRQASIEFDGVYDHAQVWVNGHFVCGRPYGYSSFTCALTPHLRFGDGDNVIAVRVDHSRFADSRWYTGSGLYRHVRLRLTGPLHIAHWGTFVTSPVVTDESATVRVETTVENLGPDGRPFVLETDVLSVLSDRTIVVARTSTSGNMDAGARQLVRQEVEVANPRRWSVDSPTRYRVRQRLRSDATIVDAADTTFGIRTIRFDAGRGFFLNEQPIEIKGVCLHHDAGSLGAAVPEAVWERRLRALKELGANAVRTSHNPPAPEFLDLCDRLGLLVQDEAFDEFTPPKNKWVNGWNEGVPSRFGYGEVFAEWAVADVETMVRRDRNHPSIIMWSIGNEIDYPNDPFTHPVLGKGYRPQNPPADRLVTLGRPLVEAVKRLDPTRPVTAALASVAMSDAAGFSQLLDIVGYNYQEPRYADDHARDPRRVIYGSENNHQFRNWAAARDHAHVAGQFLWTGVDYLGEARVFPNRANGAGLLDLCGFKKPMAWFRESLWSGRPMVYLAASAAAPAPGGAAPARQPRPEERWNWQAGSDVTVSCYTNCDEVELTLNGAVVGTRSASEAVDGVLTWNLPYQPGLLRAVGRTKGEPAAAFTLRTAGAPSRIELVPVASGSGDESGIHQVEFRIVDGQGVRATDSDALVTFAVESGARVLGIGNGNLNDIENPSDLVHRAYQGRGLIILQASSPAQPITLSASSPGLESARYQSRR